ncbi:MAG: pyridoxamine 5'-phosphate oxidase family protein [Bacillota bacterium]|nr:pyridoxamine 5'-phosphate oxidase family protein [Bacillota bacterium]
MRRKDREITDQREIRRIIDAAIVCRLALNTDEAPYIVPLNFGVLWDGESPLFYFHSARRGYKFALLELDDRAALEIDSYGEVAQEGRYCQYGLPYRSVIATGRIEIVTDAEEKTRGLRAIVGHSCRDGQLVAPDFRFSEAELDGVCVYKLMVRQLSAKGSG